MSRKRLKRKRRCCPACKPGKRALSNRWSPREQMLLGRFEKARQRGSDWDDA